MSLPSPKLADLIDASAVQSLMDDFYESCACEALIGNEMFIGKTVYLDFAGRRFAVAGGE
jgi:hypothetical protein